MDSDVACNYGQTGHANKMLIAHSPTLNEEMKKKTNRETADTIWAPRHLTYTATPTKHLKLTNAVHFGRTMTGEHFKWGKSVVG